MIVNEIEANLIEAFRLKTCHRDVARPEPDGGSMRDRWDSIFREKKLLNLVLAGA